MTSGRNGEPERRKIMLIYFNEQQEKRAPGMNGGVGEMSAKRSDPGSLLQHFLF